MYNLNPRDFRVAFVTNRLQVDIKDDIDRFVRYEREHSHLNIRPAFFTTDLDLGHVPFGIYTVEDNKQKELWGLWDVKDDLRALDMVPRHLFHACVFLYDLEDTGFRSSHPGATVGHWTTYGELYSGTEFVEIATTRAWDRKNDIFRVLTHEIRHVYVARLRRKGYQIPDYMDATPVNDKATGKVTYVPYYNEFDLAAPYSNRVATDRVLNGFQAAIVDQPILSNLVRSIMTYAASTPLAARTRNLTLMAEAIKKHEGWYVGSRSHRNNNPGNAKYLKQKNTVGSDREGFAIFKTYADGWSYLLAMLSNAAHNNSRVYRADMSLYDFFAVYAPAADNNNPRRYAEAVAAHIGVPATTTLRELIA